ncbi:OmpA family protein [Ornithinimicrobium avium]|nr:OmpA family protein [Ornithinimicrobium avium]
MAVLLLLLLLTGCAQASGGQQGAAPSASGCEAGGLRENVILVLGTHANMPRPVLTAADGATTSPELSCALDHLLLEGGQLTVIGVDGAPAQTARKRFAPLSAEVNDKNGPGKERLLRERRSELDDLLNPTPLTEGADLHRALDLALRAASREPAASVVFVLDNGLSDRGAVDMTRAGWSTSEASDVASAVAQSGQALQQSPGVTVVLSGLGGTFLPQPELHTVQERAVTAIWEALVRDTGADVTVDATAWTRVEGNVTELSTGFVEPIRPPVVDLRSTATTQEPVLLYPGSLHFEPDGADPQWTDEGRAVIENFARVARERTDEKLYVVGRTDSMATRKWASNDELSQARADAVRDLLIDLGVDARQIVSMGQGYAGCPDDGGLDGVDPGKRHQNRVVVIGVLPAGEPVPTGCFYDKQD